MSAPFQPGDVVVCVDDSPCGCGCGDDSGLANGHVYRVGEMVNVAFHYPDDPWNVFLLNFDHSGPHHPHGESLGAHRFRKIDDEQYPEALAAIRAIGKSKVAA